MTAPSRWARVSPDSPCPVCGKPDWCLRARSGDAVLCPRVESGRRCGDAGWLHRLANADARHRRPSVRRVMLPPSAPPADPTAFADGCRAAADPPRLAAFARSLGLSTDALTALRVGWSAGHRAWTFPMTDPAPGRVTGVRLRRPDGFKFAVKGGRDGLFLPSGSDPADRRLLVVTEGPTDAAALLDLGFPNVAGRPSCTGGVRHVAELIRLRKPAEVVLVADVDEPGRRGAERLASALAVYAPAVRVVTPPGGVKDVRDWKRAGAARADVERLIAAGPTRRLTLSTREVRRGQ